MLYEDRMVSKAEQFRQHLQSAVEFKEHDSLAYLNSVGNQKETQGLSSSVLQVSIPGSGRAKIPESNECLFTMHCISRIHSIDRTVMQNLRAPNRTH